MHFTTFCNNKGCRKEMEPVVDKDTLVAYCTECNKEIDLSIFMRRQMAANGMVKKDVKKKQPWSVTCVSCKKEAPPLVEKNKLYCQFCKEEMTNISKPFAEIIKQNLKTAG